MQKSISPPFNEILPNEEKAPSYFQGRKEGATYRDAAVWRYRGNPMIEGLPDILTDKEASKQMACYPPYNESERKLPVEVRIHLTHTPLELFVPLPDHTDLEQRISCLLRNGYVTRNPLETGHWRKISESVA